VVVSVSRADSSSISVSVTSLDWGWTMVQRRDIPSL